MYCLGFKSLNTVRSINSCFYFGVNVKTCHTLLQIMSQGKLEKQPLGEGNLPRDVYIIIVFFDFSCYLLYSIRRISHPSIQRKKIFSVCIVGFEHAFVDKLETPSQSK